MNREQLEQMSTAELRRLAREKGATGVVIAMARKGDLINLLVDGVPLPSTSACSDYSLPENASTASTSADADKAAQLAGLLASMMPKGEIDEGRVREIAAEVVEAAVAGINAPNRVVVENKALNIDIDCGVQHRKFKTLLGLCAARDADGYQIPCYLYGPAGTGKTTAAINVCKALFVDVSRFYYNGAIDSEYKLSGFVDAGGVFRSRPFYDAYANGGVYLFDELDSSMPGAVLAFNAALANGYADFPCGRVTRHKDCVILAAGNTCMRGDGGVSGFQRNKQDSAFRDRFIYLEWPIDERLEDAMAAAYGDVGTSWLATVRKIRAAAAKVGVRDFEVTPRATKNGAALLAQGVPESVVVNATIRKGLGDSAWRQIQAAC